MLFSFRLSLTVEGETLLLGIHAEHLRIYEALKGTEIIALKVNAASAVLSMVQDTRYLVADGIITQLGMDWKPLDTCRLQAASTAEDAYALERRDALEMENRDCPGTIGGMLFCYRGWVYYACGDVFNRCGTPHTDTFLCRAKSWKGPYTRRYLTIPCGGGASFFTDDQDHLYAAIIGQEDSVVRAKAAILPLEMADEGFIRPVRTAITEKTITATMHPLSVCDSIRDSFLYACPDGWYYLTGTTKTPHQGYWQGPAASACGVPKISPALKAWASSMTTAIAPMLGRRGYLPAITHGRLRSFMITVLTGSPIPPRPVAACSRAYRESRRARIRIWDVW